MFLRLERRERVRNAGIRTAGRLDHHVDALVGNRVTAVIGKAGARDARRIPAHGLAGKLGALRIEIGDDRDLKPCNRRRLRQKHRAELAGADQSDADRLAGFEPRGEEGLQAHNYSAATRCARAYSSNASSATGTIGAKSRCAIHSARVNLVMWLEQAHSVR